MNTESNPWWSTPTWADKEKRPSVARWAIPGYLLSNIPMGWWIPLTFAVFMDRNNIPNPTKVLLLGASCCSHRVVRQCGSEVYDIFSQWADWQSIKDVLKQAGGVYATWSILYRTGMTARVGQEIVPKIDRKKWSDRIEKVFPPKTQARLQLCTIQIMNVLNRM